MILVSGLAAFLICFGLTRWLSNPNSALFIVDKPNARSLHSRPTPRGGGLGIVAAALVASAIGLAGQAQSGGVGWLAAGVLAVAAVSFVDDRSHVPPLVRLGVHFGAAFALVAGGLSPDHLQLPGISIELTAWVGSALALLFVAWMTNLYNFMDGMDGFAGGMAVIGFGCFAVMSWVAGHEALTTIAVSVSAAAAAFLFFNFPPARIFMGDVGSSVLGFLAAALSLWAARDAVFPLWIGVVVFSPFIVDATATLVLRLMKREAVWQAHRNHSYQRLVRLGWTHRRTVLYEYVLMLACAAGAIAAQSAGSQIQWFVLSACLVIEIMLMYVVRRLESRLQTQTADPLPGS